jgi:hypothetical protein
MKLSIFPTRVRKFLILFRFIGFPSGIFILEKNHLIILKYFLNRGSLMRSSSELLKSDYCGKKCHRESECCGTNRAEEFETELI